jgi:phosphosulfolactate synthase
MIDTRLDLPLRESAPRRTGLTMVIDTGLFTGQFVDAVESVGEYVDMVKFGWCTGLVTRDIKRKIDVLREAGIVFYFGGTLFERFALDGMVGEFRDVCAGLGATHVEVSNGTIAMSNAEKARWVAALAEEFTVISEVGFKDPGRAGDMSSAEWVDAIGQDLAAGARLVTTEARESGRSGLCRPDGQLRGDIVEDVLTSGADVEKLIFEAPTKELQTWFVKRLGAGVNLGNVHAQDVLSLETLRLGLRSDTMRTERHPDVIADFLHAGR